jgi:ATP-dependent Lon protease
VLIPFENKKDIEEIPKRILKKVEIVLVRNMDEVLQNALVLEDGEALFASEEDSKAFSIAELIQVEKSSPPGLTAH